MSTVRVDRPLRRTMSVCDGAAWFLTSRSGPSRTGTTARSTATGLIAVNRRRQRNAYGCPAVARIDVNPAVVVEDRALDNGQA